MVTCQDGSASHFELFITPSTAPISMISRLHNPAFSPDFPSKYLLSILPQQSLLALRRVSRQTKAWIEPLTPAIFSSLRVDFPTDEFTSLSPTPLHRLSRHCRSLTVRIVGSERPQDLFQNLPEQEKLPSFLVLRELCIVASTENAFHSLLAFRLFLQSANVPNLRNIAIKELFLGDIFAIRWGPLTSLIDADWGCSTVWRHLTNFEVSLRPWPRPLRTQKGDPSTYQAQSHGYTQKEWRAGLKVLHSWVGSFAAENQFEKVRIEWLGGGEELNPLLLEEGRSWFSAPAIRWKVCKELWLGGIKVHANDETNDMERLLERVPGLQKIMVWPEMLDMGVLSGLDKFGIEIERKIIRVKGRKWMSMEIKRSPEILDQLISEIQVEAGAARGTNYSASSEENVFEDDVSVYATENIDEGNDNGNEYEDEDEDEDRSGYLSDGSMEVPLFVDLRYE